MSNPEAERARRRLDCHQAVHDPVREPRNRSPRLPELRRWQARRLERSFAHFLAEPRTRLAARFFLDDLYGDRDFSARDRGMAKVLPLMARLLPAQLLGTLADAIELGTLSHAFDLRVAAALESILPSRDRIDEAGYAAAYREAGHPRLRRHQIALIRHVGETLEHAVATPGVVKLLRASRLPAKVAGLGELQRFLERGFAAFVAMDGDGDFLDAIARQESEVSRRLFAGDPDPFAAVIPAKTGIHPL